MKRGWIAAVAVTAVCLLVGGRGAWAEEAAGDFEPAAYYFDHVHVSVVGGGTPFYAVAYTVRTVGETTFVAQTKQYPHVPVYDNRVALLDPEDAARFYGRLGELDVFQLADAGEAQPFSLSYEVSLGHGGLAHRFVVESPDLLEDLRYARVVELVRTTVEKHTGSAFFRDILVPEGDLGLLNLRTFPPAQVEIDGVPLGRTSPVFGFELAPGVHTATLNAPALGLTRRVKFSIYKGQVTNLNLNLKK